VSRHDEIGARQSSTGRKESFDHRSGDRERGVGDDTERAARKSEVGGVGNDDRDRLVPKPALQVPGPGDMELDRDDTRAGVQQRRREGAATGADVDDQITRAYASSMDEPQRRVIGELVPSPVSRLCAAHDAPSR
jgi:hypothetical protein